MTPPPKVSREGGGEEGKDESHRLPLPLHLPPSLPCMQWRRVAPNQLPLALLHCPLVFFPSFLHQFRGCTWVSGGGKRDGRENNVWHRRIALPSSSSFSSHPLLHCHERRTIEVEKQVKKFPPTTPSPSFPRPCNTGELSLLSTAIY